MSIQYKYYGVQLVVKLRYINKNTIICNMQMFRLTATGRQLNRFAGRRRMGHYVRRTS